MDNRERPDAKFGQAHRGAGSGCASQHIGQRDTSYMYDSRSDVAARGDCSRPRGGPGRGSHGRRAKGYRRLWEHVKSVGRGDTLDTDGRSLLPCEMSVEELVKVCTSLPPDGSAVAAVAPALAYLDSRAMAAFMKELARAHQLARAMELFEWLKSLPADHELYNLCDVYTFTTAISLMGPSQQLRHALELVGEMRARGLQCNVHTYSALMNVCIKCDASDLALDVFQQMHEDRIRPNVVTYNTLVDVYGKTGQWEKAVRVLDDMREEDLEPEVRTFNTAIIACNMCGQPLEALKVYQKLLEAGLQPISTTYTALISAYGKAGQLEKALDTFQAMIQQGCERSVITYSALINACEKAGRWELAMRLFDQMQREGCSPNTVTYNSLITACQQGGQPDKACEVFEQMKYQGCRPDVVTYTALINAYSKAGQWHKAIKSFEQMQQHNCKPDSFVYQTVIDSLWQTGISWAQSRAWQLYTAATRNWQYRFTMQQASSTGRDIEYVVPVFAPGVAVLALLKWLTNLMGQMDNDATLLGIGRERMVLSLGRSRHVKEPGSSHACQAVLTILQGFKSPFSAGDGGVTAAGNVVMAEAPVSAALGWLKSPELPEYLALLLPSSISNRRQSSPPGGPHKRISFASDLAEDAQLEDSCQRAYNTVLDFELGQLLQPANMNTEYLAEREACISAAFKLAEQFSFADEVVFDAVLLMDRVMSTGAQHDSSLSMLFVVAALRTAALQTVPSTDQVALSSIPTDELLAAAVGFPSGSVEKMEGNICTALSGDTKSISMLRSLRLFMERMGIDQQDTPAAMRLSQGIIRLLRSTVSAPLLLSARPSVVAAAVLLNARTAVGQHPFFPSCLEQLTGMAGTAGCPELAAAAAAVAPLTPAASLDPLPQPVPSTAAHLAAATASGPLGLNSNPLLGHIGSNMSGGSSYSSPSHVNTSTARASAAPFVPNKSLLDAVRQQTLQRAGSDMSSMSTRTCSNDGSNPDLQALLASASAAAAAGSMSGSPVVNAGLGSTLAVSEPSLAAAMAGLQLNLAMQGSAGGVFPPVPGLAFNPWLAPGGYNAFPDFYQAAVQQQGGSRLQQMTSPYVLPMQNAMFLGSGSHLLQ